MVTMENYSGTTYAYVINSDDAASTSGYVQWIAADQNNIFKTQPIHEWNTDLWKRQKKQFASRRINTLQGRMVLAKGSREKTRLELRMLSLSEIVKGAN